jgi:predicted Rossmann fold nucleotide-binding protein DprA/Smf involved in DNA uptake
MSDKAAAKKRIELFKELREEHKGTVEKAQAYLKNQQALRRQLRKAMKDGPKTIPEIAQGAELPADQVLWHVMAMKKYDLVREVGMEAEYYQYQLTEEIEK